MKCPKCNAENEENSSTCSSCGVDLGMNIPRMVFLNQASRCRYSQPINSPIATMAFLELGKHKKGIIICLVIFILIGIVTYFLR